MSLECTKCGIKSDYNQPSCWQAGYTENGETIPEGDRRIECEHDMEEA